VRIFLAATSVLAMLACGGEEGPPDTDGSLLDAADGDAGTDAAVDARAVCPPSFAACATYADHTAASLVQIVIGPNDTYAPPCIRVRAGAQVRIEADGEHPLIAAPCSPEDFVTAPHGGTMTTATYTMSAAGQFGYYCPAHSSSSGNGMAGAILVEP
jgi:plastocyanin